MPFGTSIPTELGRRVQLAAAIPKYNAAVHEERAQRRNKENVSPLITEDTPGWEQKQRAGDALIEDEQRGKRTILTTPKGYLPNMKHLIKAGSFLRSNSFT